MSTLALPDGWKREEVKRNNGLSSGKVDIVYISPGGKRIKSKLELAKYVGPNVDLSTFDYRTGKINSSLLRKNNKRSSVRMGSYDYRSLRNDPSLTPPSRQTSSIYKQSVKVVRSQPESVVLNSNQIKDYFKKKNIPVDPKLLDTNDKPFQVLWHKRLEGKHASNIDSSIIDNFQLPPTMKAFSSSLAENDTLLRSVTAALSAGSQTVRGQDKILMERKRKATYDEPIVRDPTAFVNPHQPLIQLTILSEDDIRKQEEIVLKARQKLKDALKDFQLIN